MVKAKYKKIAEENNQKKIPILWLLSFVIALSALSSGVVYRRIILPGFADLSHDIVSPLLDHIQSPAIHAWNRAHRATTIGFFVSVTNCGSEKLVDGAAVLKHSIHLASTHGDLGGRYDYRMHAIYHPDAAGCVSVLKELGYKLEERITPVQVQDIQGDFLRNKIESNGCCGSKELIKLEAYTFTEYPIVVHVDIDFLLLKPLDDLFDSMLADNSTSSAAFGRLRRMHPDKPKPPTINAFFTRDYFVVNWNIRYKPVQGGFLVLRPSKDVYKEYIEIVRKGDFREGHGWGDAGVGPFYGAMTVQGLLPYYYDVLHPNESVDLNPCNYNLMAGNPFDKPMTEDGEYQGRCRSGQTESECEDCRLQEVQNMESVHFTTCQKPWFCLPYKYNLIEHRICRKIVHEWYRVRSSMEQSWGRSGYGPGNWDQSDFFFGYCTEREKAGYVLIAKPYGHNASYG